MIHRIKHILFLLFSVAFYFSQAALTNHGIFKQLTVEDGLSNSVVYSIFQDKDDFIWFATKDGVNKFDGINFTNYTLTDQPSKYALDNMILSFNQTDDSPLYCSTESGRIYYFDKEKDRFERIQINGLNPLISAVYDMYFTDPNHIIVCSASGLFYIDIPKKSIQYINKINLITQTITVDSEGIFWIGTNQGILTGKLNFNLPLEEQNIEKFPFLKQDVILSLKEDSDQKIWIGTRDHGLFVYDKKSKKLITLNDKITANKEQIVPVRDIEFHANKTYIALDGEGIFVFDKSFNLVSKFVHFDDIPQSLSNKGVYDIFFDSDQTMWVATYGGGVSRYSSNTNKFNTIKHEPYNSNSLKNNTARAFLELSSGNLWFGTKKGISIYNRKTKKWKHLLQNNDRDEDVIVLTMYQASDGYVWAGTYNKGLLKINPRNLTYQKVQQVDQHGNLIGPLSIYSIIEDDLGRIWAGGIIGNLLIYNPQTKSGTEIEITNVKVIKESSWGEVYVGTTEGLYVVNPNSLEKQRPQPYSVLLNQNRIFSILEKPDSIEKQLWIGTEGGGLIYWNIDNNTIKVYSTDHGLPSNFIYGMETDQKNAIWVSTTKGLSRLNQSTNEFKNYNKSDGLSDQEFNFGAHGKTQQGEIFFGGQNGFTFFNPDSLVEDNKIPALVFNSFKLFGKEQLIDNDKSVLKKHINTSSHIELKHNQNSISFGFSAINFINPNKIKYSWKLKGFDENWSIPDVKREAIYTNLKPGDYQFLVKSSNHDGVWGENLRTISFTIRPPITQTIWAYLIYLIIATGGAYFIFNFFRIRIKERNALAKTRFFVNIAHDLRTPLTLIKAPIERLNQSNSMKNEDLNSLMIANKNINRLNRLVTQLMDFQKADLSKTELRPAPHQFIRFVKELGRSFTPLMEHRNLKLVYDFPEVDFELWFDHDKMEKILYNLISNAIKYSKEYGKIKLSVIKQKGFCEITISDQGIGIPLNQQKKIFTRYFRARNVINSQETGSGVGLVLVKKLVELHKGTIRFTSVENQGTTFHIKIPIKKYNTEVSKEIKEIKETNEHFQIFKKTINCTTTNTQTHVKYKILLVEDNKELLQYLSSVLSNYYQILEAENGKIAIKLVHQKNPDLIVSDVMMPEMDGNEMCSILKNDISTSHIPLILLTSLNTVNHKIKSFNVGADSFIEKPFVVDYLIARINNLLTTRQRLKEKYAFHPEIIENDTSVKSLDQDLLIQARDYISKNITNQDLSVETLAKEMCMSRPVLYRKLKALTDQSPQDFIRLHRLLKAKTLLLSKNYNISDVAYETGFTDPKYFSTSFKKFFNITPTQFVKDHQKKEE